MADDKKHAEIDAALVRQLAEILNETDLTEVEVERGELRPGHLKATKAA